MDLLNKVYNNLLRSKVLSAFNSQCLVVFLHFSPPIHLSASPLHPHATSLRLHQLPLTINIFQVFICLDEIQRLRHHTEVAPCTEQIHFPGSILSTFRLLSHIFFLSSLFFSNLLSSVAFHHSQNQDTLYPLSEALQFTDHLLWLGHSLEVLFSTPEWLFKTFQIHLVGSR